MTNKFTPQPWAPISQTAENKLLPAAPNHPFYYKWHPSNWRFAYIDIPVKSGKSTKMEKRGYFLPSIRMERVVPGVNGIHQISGEIGNAGSRIGKLQQLGWIYLEPSKYQYISVYPVRGGRYHAPKWESVRVVGNTLLRSFDEKGFLQWSASLILDGTFHVIEPHFWELMKIQHNKTINRLSASQHIPEIKIKLNESYKIAEDMLSFMQRYEELGINIYKEITDAN